MPYVLWPPAAAFALSVTITWWLSLSKLSRFALDHPNQRSLHESPVPRMGGVGLHAGVACAWLIAGPDLPVPLAIGALVLFVISFVDDVRGLHVLLRLLAHLGCAALFAMSVVYPVSDILALAVAAIAIAWMINVYNFMDGSDGLAGGMAFIGFAAYGCAAWGAGDAPLAALDFGIAAASAGFLVFNLNPARVFLGDAGSVPLGYLAATLGIMGWLHGDWPSWYPVCVFSPFIVDASVTLARRMYRRERVWQAHRDHYYQRLVQLGWGHAGTAWAEYALMLGCAAAALFALKQGPLLQAATLAVVAFVYVIAAIAIEGAWRAHRTRHAS